MQAYPLAGIRVLDLSRILAGPWSAQLLADYGAEVLKIERPDGGDDTRHWGPPFAKTKTESNHESAYFLSANRGKKSLCIDLKDPRGADLVRRLAKESDIVLENFKKDDLKRYGLDYESLSKEEPGRH